jgi:hypothetical protein
VRFREDRPEDLIRARSEVAAWRAQYSDGTADELVTAIGHQYRRTAGGLPVRPAAGTVQARAYLEDRGPCQAPESGGLAWRTDPAVLRRVRDALSAGGQR